MKKLIKLSLFSMCIMFVSLATNSCGGTVDPPDDPNDTIVTNPPSIISMTAAEVVYITPEEGDIEHMVLNLTSENLFMMFGIFIGDGELIQLYLLSEPTGEMELTPGTYPIKPFNGSTFEAGTAIAGEIIQNKSMGSLLVPVKESTAGNPKPITGGEVIITEKSGSYEVTANLEIAGKEYTYTYSGKIKVTDGRPDPSLPYQYEPMEVSAIDYSYDSVELINNGVQADSKGNDQISLTVKNDTLEASFVLYAPKGSTSANGTYAIADTQGINSAQKSLGAEGDNILPSYFAIINSDGDFRQIYFLVSGTITIDDNGVTFDTKSYRGSSIKGTYSGKVSFIEPSASSKTLEKVNYNIHLFTPTL